MEESTIAVAEEIPQGETAKNLATVRKIKSLSPIEGADRIEVAKLEDLEWQVVVQKGIHTVGDLVVYCQIDTIAPETTWSAFLKDRHYRIRTIRLRKILSQGLILPIKDIVDSAFLAMTSLKEGDDVTDLTGIMKYEKPIPANLKGKIKGTFPTSLVPKTDEERIQNCSRILEELKDIPVYYSIKLDGTSTTFIHFNGETHVCSRNMSLKPAEGEDKPTVYWEMEIKHNILEKLKTKGNYAIQGEIVGPGINKNKMNF